MIGERPIDLHIMALQKMGVQFWEEENMLLAKAKRLHGAEISLPFASVGATENIILAATMAEGDTTIIGAAKEPEITVLCRYLECCGATIEGAGTNVLTIRGGRTLFGTEYRVPEDRIVAGTYLFGAIVTGGCILLENAPGNQLEEVLCVAKEMGAQCDIVREGIYVQAVKRPKAAVIHTAPYPGFPTDLQSMALVAFAVAEGKSRIEENIFENRFQILEPLKRMGADVRMLSPTEVEINGVKQLHGISMERWHILLYCCIIPKTIGIQFP